MIITHITAYTTTQRVTYLDGLSVLIKAALSISHRLIHLIRTLFTNMSKSNKVTIKQDNAFTYVGETKNGKKSG
tara:strand:- start:352 stop:573 length:222 start_codon:yes stop_codon:yes gene_type:complete